MFVLVPASGAALSQQDTATGTGALGKENGGNWNTADGYFALGNNTIGNWNTAVGFVALTSNIDGSGNVALGYTALLDNTTGEGNTAAGSSALVFNETGSFNTAVGEEAGLTSLRFRNPAGTRNTFLGAKSGPGTTQLNNATAVGAGAVVSESNALVLGRAGARVGVGTERPQSLMQVGGTRSTYDDYLQIPVVTSSSAPPASDCRKLSGAHSTAGRLVIQYNRHKARTTLWSCSPDGTWTKLAQG